MNGTNIITRLCPYKSEWFCEMMWNMTSRQEEMRSDKVNRPFRKFNRSPKSNMWSAIPIALLCMIANLSERKQGSGHKRDEVL